MTSFPKHIFSEEEMKLDLKSVGKIENYKLINFLFLFQVWYQDLLLLLNMYKLNDNNNNFLNNVNKKKKVWFISFIAWFKKKELYNDEAI